MTSKALIPLDWAKPISTASKTPTDCWKESLCFFPQLNYLVSWEVIAGGHIIYAAVVYFLWSTMKSRKQPFVLKYPMMLYNFCQIFISLAMVIGLFPYVLKKVFNVGGAFEHDIEFWVLAHYLAKYLDMFDTVFILLRKKDKQFSFLHVYHHLGIGIIWGGLLHWGVGNGTCFFGAWINSLVHAMMYSHYFAASLNIENPFKTYLTKFQMFQFALCIVHAILVVVFDTTYPQKVSLIQVAYHPTLLYLFFDYLQGEQKAKKLAAEAEKKQKNIAATAGKQTEKAQPQRSSSQASSSRASSLISADAPASSKKKSTNNSRKKK